MENQNDQNQNRDQNVRSIFLGLDIGTTSIKVSAVNNEGKELYSKTDNTNADVKNNNMDGLSFEQNPLTIFRVLDQLVHSILSTYSTRIKGIGICGQMHGVVLWKRSKVKGAVVGTAGTKAEGTPQGTLSLEECAQKHCPSNLFTWQDQRCSDSFLASLPPVSNRRLPLSTGHGCATLFWLSRYGDKGREISEYDCCGTIMDFLVFLLCGLEHPVTSDQLASSFGYYNVEQVGWDQVLKDSLEFSFHLLPSVKKAGTKAGSTCNFLSYWPADVPVSVAMGDVQCAMGAVLTKPSQAAINISTSIQLGFLVPYKDIDLDSTEWPTSVSFFPYFGEVSLALCAGLNGGNAVHHFVEVVASWMKDLGFPDDSCLISSVFSKLQALAEQPNFQKQGDVCPSDDVLTFRPTFYGERHNPTLKAEISNISLSNFQQIGRVFQAVCHGVVHHLASMVPAHFLCQRQIRELLVCGSVARNNPFVKEALKKDYDVGGIQINFDNTELDSASSAFGAAKMVLDFSSAWSSLDGRERWEEKKM